MNSALDDTRKQTLDAWFTRYGDDLLRTCFAFLGDRALAEDALQDTFVKVWQHMDSFEARGGASPRTWIMRIAINTCKDYRRTAWYRRIDWSRAMEELPMVARPDSDPSRSVFLEVLRLPDKLKQVVLLYHFHNMTMADIAEVLRTSRSTVQYRLHRAYALLRTQLEGSEWHE